MKQYIQYLFEKYDRSWSIANFAARNIENHQ
mgnify:CR=1 FL=1